MNPDVQLGLSYRVIEDGFVHYAMTAHNKGEDVQKTYTDLHQWLFDSDYTALREAGVDYYDPYMPIKHEYYPVDQDPDDPHFDIYIPIVEK